MVLLSLVTLAIIYLKRQLMLFVSLSECFLQCVASHPDTRMLFLNGNVVDLCEEGGREGATWIPNTLKRVHRILMEEGHHRNITSA